VPTPRVAMKLQRGSDQENGIVSCLPYTNDRGGSFVSRFFWGPAQLFGQGDARQGGGTPHLLHGDESGTQAALSGRLRASAGLDAAALPFWHAVSPLFSDGGVASPA
jgi:hypothetical protein